MNARDPETPLDPIEDLLAACLEEADDAIDTAIERACAEHPEHASALRERLALLEELEGPFGARGEEPDLPERLGDFRLLERLGGGGMGIVHRAVQESLGRDGALKIVRPEQLYFPDARARFRREAEAIAQLAHPGIVPIHTVGEHSGLPYFAMELVHGATLAEVLRRVRGRDPARLSGRDMQAAIASQPATPLAPPFDGGWVEACVDVVRQVALALQHAHERGVLHRDVKPSNVLLTPDGRACLCDFGLSTGSVEERLTRVGSQVGTLPYMSPEQAEDGRALDARADVYGLGVTLYELLSLQLPYLGDDAAATLARILHGDPDSLRARNRRVPRDVDIVCTKAMARERRDRYRDARAFAADLEAWLAGRPIRARPPGRVARTARWVGRHKARTLAGALLAALVIGLPVQRWLHHLELWRSEAIASARMAREVELTSHVNRFLLGLFQRAATLAPSDDPLTATDVLRHGARTVGDELADDPTARARIQVLLARPLYDLRQYDDAAELCAAAIATMDANPEHAGRLMLTDALLIAAQVEVARRELERADALLDRLFRIHAATPPRDPDAVVAAQTTRAEVWMLRGDDAAAAELLSELLAELERRPDATRRHVGLLAGQLGTTLLSAGDDERALPLLERAIASVDTDPDAPDPDLCALYSNLGLLRKRNGDPEGAAEAYERAVLLADRIWTEPNPSRAILGANLETLHDTLGDPQAALTAYTAAVSDFEALGLETSREAMVAGVSMGAMLFALERYEEAADVLAAWHEQQSAWLGRSDPRVAGTYWRRARCAAESGRFERARELVELGLDGLEVAPDSDHGTAERARLEGLRDELGEAGR